MTCESFSALCSALNVSPDVTALWFERISAAYSEPTRAYHTLAHLAAMFNHLERVGCSSTAVQLAVWFHDIVYDARRKDNEERSADVFTEFAEQIGLAHDVAERVRALIRATIAHKLPAELADDRDAQLFLDVDLSILAAPADVYDAYARGIRHEYAFVADDAYRQGRAAVLRSLTAKDVFLSPHFHTAAIEAAAKLNVEREIAFLSSHQV